MELKKSYRHSVGASAYRHLHVLDVLVEGVHYLHGDVNDRGDLVAGQ